VIVNRIRNKKAPPAPKRWRREGQKPYRGTTPIPYCVTNPKRLLFQYDYGYQPTSPT